MTATLQLLVNSRSFISLQDEVERWLNKYDNNSSDQNTEKCIEVIKLNLRVHELLLRVLDLTAVDSGSYGGPAAIKARLLTMFNYGQRVLSQPEMYNKDIRDSPTKGREPDDSREMYVKSLAVVETKLRDTQTQVDKLKTELRSTKTELINERARSELLDKYESGIDQLKHDVIQLTKEEPSVGHLDLNGLRRSQKSNISAITTTQIPSTRSVFSKPSSHQAWDLRAATVDNSDQQKKLVHRFNDMFLVDRAVSLNILRDYSENLENNEKIIFIIMQESFMVARLALINFKMKVRSKLAALHTGPEALEQAVLDYIGSNEEVHNVNKMISEVISGLNRHPGISLPPSVSFNVVQAFIGDACKLAWSMSALQRPLELASATSLELYEDSKYRRSLGSNPTGPLVSYHIWPCLIQGSTIIAKGEVCTERGSLLTTYGNCTTLSNTSPLSSAWNSSTTRNVFNLSKSLAPRQ